MFYLKDVPGSLAEIWFIDFQGYDRKIGAYDWKNDSVQMHDVVAVDQLELLGEACRIFRNSMPEKAKMFTKEWLETFDPELAKTVDWDEHPEGYEKPCLCGECCSSA
jgi:hypothetical protein